MAIRLYGQKLPPLPVKTKIAQSFHSDEDKSFFIEDSEDEPLLSKNVGEKKAADVVRTLKDACTTSSNFHKHNTNERSKVHYSSTEDSRMSPCSSANGVTSAPHNDQSIQAASSNRCTISALVENGDHTHSGSESSREGPHLSDLFLKRDTDPPVLEVDRFDLYITNTLHGPESRLGRMTRSVSSTESSKHPHDVTDSRACLELRQLHRLKPQHKWPGISRSQSQPLATSEEEYSMYWRGDVTVIEMPGAELPDVSVLCEFCFGTFPNSLSFSFLYFFFLNFLSLIFFPLLFSFPPVSSFMSNLFSQTLNNFLFVSSLRLYSFIIFFIFHFW